MSTETKSKLDATEQAAPRLDGLTDPWGLFALMQVVANERGSGSKLTGREFKINGSRYSIYYNKGQVKYHDSAELWLTVWRDYDHTVSEQYRVTVAEVLDAAKNVLCANAAPQERHTDKAGGPATTAVKKSRAKKEPQPSLASGSDPKTE